MENQDSANIRQTQYADIIRTLENRINHLTNINEGQKRTILRTQSLIQQYKSQRDLADGKSQQLTLQIAEMKREMDMIDREKREFRKRVQDLQSALLQSSTTQDVGRQIGQLNFENSRLLQENTHLRVKNQDLTVNIEQLSNELQKVKEILQKQKGFVPVLPQVLKQVSSSELNVHANFNDNYMLNQSIRRLNQQNNQLKKIITFLRQKPNVNQRGFEQTVQLTISSTHKSDTVTQLGDKQAIEQVTKLIQDNQQSLKQKQRIIEELNNRVQELQIVLNDKQIMIAKFKKNIQETETKLEERQSTIEKLNKRAQDFQRTLNDKQISIARFKKNIQETETKLEERQSTIEKLNNRAQDFQRILNDKQVSITRFKKTIQDTQRKLEDKQRDLHKIQSKNQDLKKSNQAYKRQLANKQSASLDNKIEFQNKSLLKQLQSCKEQLKEKQNEIVFLTKFFEQKLQQANIKLAGYIKEAELQREQLSIQRGMLQRANKQIQKLKEGQFIAQDQTQRLLYTFHQKVIQINDYLKKLLLDPKEFKVASQNRSQLKNVMKAIVDQQIY